MMKPLGFKGYLVAAAIFVGAISLTGCQMTQNGQTLPSPDYLNNQIQYFPAGTEFQYQKEVDQIKKDQAERELARQGQYNL